MVPSIKTIEEGLNLDREKAIEVRKLMDGRIDPENYQSSKDWIKDSYNPPKHSELVFCAINEIIEGYGVEGIQIEGHHTDHYWGDYIGEYINMGDTYTTTIVYLVDDKYYTPGFKICNWGAIVERYSY